MPVHRFSPFQETHEIVHPIGEKGLNRVAGLSSKQLDEIVDEHRADARHLVIARAGMIRRNAAGRYVAEVGRRAVAVPMSQPSLIERYVKIAGSRSFHLIDLGERGAEDRR